jgi:hypothetical protein
MKPRLCELLFAGTQLSQINLESRPSPQEFDVFSMIDLPSFAPTPIPIPIPTPSFSISLPSPSVQNSEALKVGSCLCAECSNVAKSGVQFDCISKRKPGKMRRTRKVEASRRAVITRPTAKPARPALAFVAQAQGGDMCS